MANENSIHAFADKLERFIDMKVMAAKELAEAEELGMDARTIIVDSINGAVESAKTDLMDALIDVLNFGILDS